MVRFKIADETFAVKKRIRCKVLMSMRKGTLNIYTFSKENLSTSLTIHSNRSSLIYLCMWQIPFFLNLCIQICQLASFLLFDYTPKRQQYISLHFLELSLRRSVSMRGKYVCIEIWGAVCIVYGLGSRLGDILRIYVCGFIRVLLPI